MVKKNEIIEVVIDEVEFPNKGIGKLDDKKVLVKNTIKGQKVKARVKKKRKNKIEANLIEVVEKASIEGEALCEHFGICGGCSYQNISYENQLKIKEEQVRKLLDSADIGEYNYLGIEGSPNEFEYRNKMEFSFGDIEKGGPLSLGMHQKGKFYEIVTVHGCQIVDKDFRDILVTILEYFREKDVSFYHKKTHKGVLRHLVVRKAIKTGEMLANLVTSSQEQLNLTELIDNLKDINLEGELKGFLHTINDGLADVVKSDETNVLYGQDYIVEEILGLKFKISAFSFFQTNSLGADKLYSIVRDFAGNTDNKILFDLYCGTGTIAQIMAPVAEKVIGIEIVEEAVEAAIENAKINNLDNCEFIAGDVMEKVVELNEKPDLIILDPPRDGIHPKAINKIIDFSPEQFIYVSCKPTSLARDLPIFVEKGYKVTKIKCMDMFPHTPHVECCSLLTRKE
ncbi:23S rRNA (uracil(1939)-C(5))-methyltransferase RlmD [Sporosalibacterium faouarense]|uniref:23S rRNA (uracil(1939)-C(5))-methyltransferase RlmD n=1 Tax=Sporosalibacterium faouarense TaxID=516123 RepID=UPI00192BEC33|nr:23S rRNA (uracil(1939)-C(5))-methyltransferase RlmD [Sporosalibacterium faouarense]